MLSFNKLQTSQKNLRTVEDTQGCSKRIPMETDELVQISKEIIVAFKLRPANMRQ